MLFFGSGTKETEVVTNEDDSNDTPQEDWIYSSYHNCEVMTTAQTPS